MYLIEFFLPLYDNEGRAFGRAPFDRVRDELTAQFGGVTAFRRAPAEGVWRTDDGPTVRDEVVSFEVMAAELDRAWWARYKTDLAARFRQDEIMLRAVRVEPL
jgi:hypothetical protein